MNTKSKQYGSGHRIFEVTNLTFAYRYESCYVCYCFNWITTDQYRAACHIEHTESNRRQKISFIFRIEFRLDSHNDRVILLLPHTFILQIIPSSKKIKDLFHFHLISLKRIAKTTFFSQSLADDSKKVDKQNKTGYM